MLRIPKHLPITLVLSFSACGMVSGEEGALAFGTGLAMIAWIAGIHLLEANFLNPKIIGDSAHIHPVVVVFALLVGEQSAGLPGALFAVPIASVLVTFFKFFHRRALQTEATMTADLAPAGPDEEDTDTPGPSGPARPKLAPQEPTSE